ncbi:hypothetical protein DPEC_G00344730 [Dallia pectoralis]|uniref:Uncharacterized protein n=1 Tax=Dallia pectoralis TaxID=75939 RepID=A0ACC2F3C3_DALPE|nr:hypothetical protein DPEC_G00344730 [Dallia pectoralis]
MFPSQKKVCEFSLLFMGGQWINCPSFFRSSSKMRSPGCQLERLWMKIIFSPCRKRDFI